MTKIIKKAIFPVAGLGTRFLPASKNVPKELFPIVDKPVIHYLVEEAINSGIEQIIFITKVGKHILEDYFDRSFELEYFLRRRAKKDLLEKICHISKMAKFYFIRQDEPKGTADAVLRAREIIGNEPCAVMYGDDLIDSKIPALKQIMKVYDERGGPVMALSRVPKKNAHLYGIVKGEKIGQRTYRLLEMAEKPEVPFSDLAIISRYIITPEIFTAIKTIKPGAFGEVWLTDAFKILLKKINIYGYEFEGDLYDCGTKTGYLKANIAFGLKDKQIRKELKEFIKDKWR